MKTNTVGKKRVLYIAHGHPDFCAGGGELAAYEMYQVLKHSSDYEPFLLTAYSEPRGRCPGCLIRQYEKDDHTYLFTTAELYYDYFFHTCIDPSLKLPLLILRPFKQFLETLKPDVVHFHHFLHMGIELISLTRECLPSAKIMMTLHEFLPICPNNGSMLRRNEEELCYCAGAHECAGCFPERSLSDFFIRERLMRTALACVDCFLAPSRFLLQRYVEWGIQREKLIFMDYGRPAWPAPAARHFSGERPFVVGYIGQIIYHKGVDIVLEAALEYLERRRGQQLPELRFVIYGAQTNLRGAVKDKIETLRQRTVDVVRMYDRFSRHQTRHILAGYDCLVVASKWWENSPLVIQEAFMAGVPVVCADIGGMAEKVQNGLNGLHFAANNPHDLLERLLQLAGSPELYDQLAAGDMTVFSDTEMSSRLHELYSAAANHGLEASLPAPGLQ